jgi:nucleoside-triphosphatase
MKNILITGLPGCGKTTLIKKLAHELLEFGPVGFFTEEVRERGTRKGFQLTSLEGKEAGRLAHVDIAGPPRVGKYGVDLPGFEHFLAKLRLTGPSARLVIIDEIGRMECFSARFRELVASLLDGPVPLIATIALKAEAFIEAVKRRDDVQIFEVAERNREKLVQEIAGRVRSQLTSRDHGG